MPCYSRVSSTVEFGPRTDATLLENALKTLGYITGRAGGEIKFRHPEHGATGNYTSGRLMIETGAWADSPVDVNEIKRAYSAEVIKAASKRFGWAVKQESPTQFQVTRRV